MWAKIIYFSTINIHFLHHLFFIINYIHHSWKQCSTSTENPTSYNTTTSLNRYRFNQQETTEQETFRRVLERCNQIEGFSPHSPKNGLYWRTIADVEVVDPITQKTEEIKAYVYFQEWRAVDLPKGQVKKFRKFPRGDWLDEDAIRDSYAEENTVIIEGTRELELPVVCMEQGRCSGDAPQYVRRGPLPVGRDGAVGRDGRMEEQRGEISCVDAARAVWGRVVLSWSRMLSTARD